MASVQAGSEWSGESFVELDLCGEDLRSCRFDECSFLRCKLTGAQLDEAILDDCTFHGCELSDVTVRSTKLRQVRLEGCRARGVAWADLYALGLELELVDSNLSYGSFFGMRLPKLAARKCVLHEVDFSECDLRGSDLRGSDLRRAIFRQTDLRKADLRDAEGLSLDPRLNRVEGLKLSLAGAVGALGVLGVHVELG